MGTDGPPMEHKLALVSDEISSPELLETVRRVCRRILWRQQPDQIDDAVQETLTKVLAAANSKRIANPVPYAFQAATRVSLNFIRAEQTRRRAMEGVERESDVISTHSQTSLDPALRAYEMELVALTEFLRRNYLNKEERQIWRMLLKGMTQREMAEILELSTTTVCERVARIRKLLLWLLFGPDEPGPGGTRGGRGSPRGGGSHGGAGPNGAVPNAPSGTVVSAAHPAGGSDGHGESPGASWPLDQELRSESALLVEMAASVLAMPGFALEELEDDDTASFLIETSQDADELMPSRSGLVAALFGLPALSEPDSVGTDDTARGESAQSADRRRSLQVLLPVTGTNGKTSTSELAGAFIAQDSDLAASDGLQRFAAEEAKPTRHRIAVFGVGGGGGNAVNNMVRAELGGVTFVAANTDRQALDVSRAGQVVQLGQRLTRGLGAGANPQKGREAALEEKSRIAELVKDYDMVFVTAGMGGGTGTGAAPVVAEAAREAGALTVGVVTKPFLFEGKPRMRNADQGIANLARHVDSLIVIPNDRLLETCSEPMVLLDAFKMADNVLRDAVRSISELIVVPGLINVDFADAARIMRGKGKALMGLGEATGEGRAVEAALQAMTSALLEDTCISGATGLLVNISGGADLKIQEIDEAMSLISKEADPSAEIIMGTVIDPNLAEKVRVTIIATGFDLERRFEVDMGVMDETAAPGGHWQQLENVAAVRRGMLAPAPRTLQANVPPALPARRDDERKASAGILGRRGRTPSASEDHFDPSKPDDWF